MILTAGALQSPAILMRAGIGPGAALQALGIPVAIDLPGVGSNLRDHPALTFCQYLPRRLRLPLARRRPNFAAMRFSSGHPGCDASDMYITAIGPRRLACAGHAARPLLSLVQPAVFERHAHARRRATPEPIRSSISTCCPTRRDLERLMSAVRLLAEACRSSGAQPRGGRFLPGLLFRRASSG